MSISLLSTSSRSIASMPHRWKRWFPSCLSCPLPDQQGVWACVYMRLCTTVKFHSVLAKWGLAFSLPVRGGVSSAGKRDSWAEFFHSSRTRKRDRNEESHAESGVATVSWLRLETWQTLAHVVWVSANITVFLRVASNIKDVEPTSVFFRLSWCSKQWEVTGGRV